MPIPYRIATAPSRATAVTPKHIPVDRPFFQDYVIDMDHEIDAIGLLCPLPVLRLRKRMMPLSAGTRIRLLADDPAAVVDVPHFCNEAGHKLIEMTQTDGHLSFLVEKQGRQK
ncbi:sulfurtransferase TusA family protein [Shimia sp.]|uniref:sulfurtransferase TusA family protein n=1 Tax=Shimia sp. TaxID=1954381 RepID=UPI003296BABD